MSLTLFGLGHFLDKILHLCPHLAWILLPIVSHMAKVTAFETTNLFVEIGVRLTFYLGWPQIMIFLISVPT
jgi:hypothetical protein